MIYVVGHKNPDTDSIVSALVFSSYLNKKKIKCQPCFIGKINRETSFVLSLINEEKISQIKKAGLKDKFYLVDHNSLEQSVPNLKKENVLGVLDHHKMSGFSTDEPIFYRSEVVGSTASLVFKLFQESGFELSKKQAFLLLAGLVSDTLKMTSPTTTLEDKRIAGILEKKSGFKINDLAQKMFKSKSDISGMKVKDIVLADFKEFTFPKGKVGFGVYETVSSDSLDGIKERIIKELTLIKKEKELDYGFFGLIDIIKKQCFLYLVSENEKKISQEIFKGKYQEPEIYLMPGIVSRKKQIMPLLSKKLS